MAIESIQDRIFTSATDIWSFGVVIWEIFNFGQTPYQGLSNTELLTFLQRGGRLRKTETVPIRVENIYFFIKFFIIFFYKISRKIFYEIFYKVFYKIFYKIFHKMFYKIKKKYLF